MLLLVICLLLDDVVCGGSRFVVIDGGGMRFVVVGGGGSRFDVVVVGSGSRFVVVDVVVVLLSGNGTEWKLWSLHLR